jgi:signal transduction histidine kinase
MSATAPKQEEGKRLAGSSTATPPDTRQQSRTSLGAARDSAAETLKRRLLRLALDVHDGPMQNLAVIGFSLGDLRRRIQSLVPAEHHDEIDPAMEQISEELVRVEAELRSLIGALEHGGISNISVVEAIETEIAEFERRSCAQVDLRIEGDVRTETDSQRIALQSVTRAALSNVAKHAAARKVTILMRGTPRTITLEIVDDGRGFSPEAARSKPGRLGLAGMRERVELLGGRFEVSSRPGGPTSITATLKTWRPSEAR